MVNKKLWIKIAREAYEAQQAKIAAAEREAKALDSLKLLSDYKSAAAGEYMLAKSYRKGSVDYNAIPLLRSIDLEIYRKEQVASWKLLRIEQ